MRRSMEPVELEVGLADSHLASYERTATGLAVVVRAWNERTVKLLFHGIIFVRDRCAGEFAELYRGADPDDEALQMALAVAFDKPAAVHPYVIYAFTNPDDIRSLEVVATGHSVIYE
jgi:hypothetical protein